MHTLPFRPAPQRLHMHLVSTINLTCSSEARMPARRDATASFRALSSQWEHKQWKHRVRVIVEPHRSNTTRNGQHTRLMRNQTSGQPLCRRV